MKEELELREKARDLLEKGDVICVIGYGAGSTPFKTTPVFIEKAEDVDKLVWNPACVNNLAVYLRDACSKGRTAVVVKPCDAKSVVELIREKQIKREDVVVIAVRCPDMLNEDALKGFDTTDIKSVEWRDNKIVVKTSDGETEIPAQDALLNKCLTCDLTKSPIVDIQIGEPFERQPVKSEYADLEEIEKLTPEERRAYWARQFARCIRCYACRAVCPGCYCKECFVEKPCQLWVMKATDTESNWFFHVTRAMHTAGRCIACGECERACPMGLPLMKLNAKLRKEVAEMFREEPGRDPEALPTLGKFDMKNDPDPCGE